MSTPLNNVAFDPGLLLLLLLLLFLHYSTKYIYSSHNWLICCVDTVTCMPTMGYVQKKYYPKMTLSQRMQTLLRIISSIVNNIKLLLTILCPLPQKDEVPSLNGITHAKHKQVQHPTVVHTVIYQFWSVRQCSGITCITKTHATSLEHGRALGQLLVGVLQHVVARSLAFYKKPYENCEVDIKTQTTYATGQDLTDVV